MTMIDNSIDNLEFDLDNLFLNGELLCETRQSGDFVIMYNNEILDSTDDFIEFGKLFSDILNNPRCPHCNSFNCYGISRVVGYFSNIDNWNNSKKSELKRRQVGNYWMKENETIK